MILRAVHEIYMESMLYLWARKLATTPVLTIHFYIRLKFENALSCGSVRYKIVWLSSCFKRKPWHRRHLKYYPTHLLYDYIFYTKSTLIIYIMKDRNGIREYINNLNRIKIQVFFTHIYIYMFINVFNWILGFIFHISEILGILIRRLSIKSQSVKLLRVWYEIHNKYKTRVHIVNKGNVIWRDCSGVPFHKHLSNRRAVITITYIMTE